jgi:hypothetical protein
MDRTQMLSRSAVWFDALTEEQRVAVLARSNVGGCELDTKAFRGYLTDEEIESEYGDIITFDATTKKGEGIAMNHQRALWLTNPEFMAKRLEDQAVLLTAQEEKKRAAETRLAAKECRAAEEEAKEKERKRRLDAVGADAVPGAKRARLTKVHCSNTACGAHCYKDSPEHETWSKCTAAAKSCHVVLCVACSPFHLAPHIDAMHKK